MKATDNKAPNKSDKMKTGFNALFSGDLLEETPTFEAGENVGKLASTNNIPALTKEEIKSRQAVADAKALANEIRVTLLMPADLHQKIKIMAHWELSTLKEIVNTSLEATIAEYEKIHGQLASVPRSQK